MRQYLTIIVFKYGYSKQSDTISQLLQHSEDKLFVSLNNPAQCVHYLLPPIKVLFPLCSVLTISSHQCSLRNVLTIS